LPGAPRRFQVRAAATALALALLCPPAFAFDSSSPLAANEILSVALSIRLN